MSARSLEGRTYVVTGSASGIGAATAALIQSRGGKVIGCDLENAEVEVDLSTSDGRASLVEQVKARSPIDAVLAIAGGDRRGVIETNYFGAVDTLVGLRPLLAESGSPRAVAISSTASLAPGDERVIQACLDGDEAAAVMYARQMPQLGPGPYGCAKRALNRWVRRVAPTREWAGAGIALNVVTPGVVDTPAAAWIFASPETRAAVESAAPQPFGGFPGRPEWIAELILWLASEENHFVTGQIIFADGGGESAIVGERHWL